VLQVYDEPQTVEYETTVNLPSNLRSVKASDCALEFALFKKCQGYSNECYTSNKSYKLHTALPHC